MKTFLVILIVDLISEDTSIPWWVQAIVLAIGSADFIWARFDKKPSPELPDSFWGDLREAYEKRVD